MLSAQLPANTAGAPDHNWHLADKFKFKFSNIGQVKIAGELIAYFEEQ